MNTKVIYNFFTINCINFSALHRNPSVLSCTWLSAAVHFLYSGWRSPVLGQRQAFWVSVPLSALRCPAVQWHIRITEVKDGQSTFLFLFFMKREVQTSWLGLHTDRNFLPNKKHDTSACCSVFTLKKKFVQFFLDGSSRLEGTDWEKGVRAAWGR